MQFGERTIYIPQDGNDAIIASLDHSVQNRLHVASQIPRICTLLGEPSSGKTALIDHWIHGASETVRVAEVVRIWLSPASDEYRSTTHMVLARILDELHRLFAPAYAPIRSRSDETDHAERFGKKQLEALRKRVDRELAQRPIRAIVVDDVQHIDQLALHYVLNLRMGHAQGNLVPKRALIFVGQEKKSARPENQLPAWLNRSEAQRHYTERHKLKSPIKTEWKGIVKHLLEEGLRATVPHDDFKVQVNREIGELVGATARNWVSLEQFIRVLDDCLQPQSDGALRLITPDVLRSVRQILQIQINKNDQHAK